MRESLTQSTKEHWYVRGQHWLKNKSYNLIIAKCFLWYYSLISQQITEVDIFEFTRLITDSVEVVVYKQMDFTAFPGFPALPEDLFPGYNFSLDPLVLIAR